MKYANEKAFSEQAQKKNYLIAFLFDSFNTIKHFLFFEEYSFQRNNASSDVRNDKMIQHFLDVTLCMCPQNINFKI